MRSTLSTFMESKILYFCLFILQSKPSASKCMNILEEIPRSKFLKNHPSSFLICRARAGAAPVCVHVELVVPRGHTQKTAGLWSWFPDLHTSPGGWGWGLYAVAQLLDVLGYKPEGRGFDTRWCHWKFFIIWMCWCSVKHRWKNGFCTVYGARKKYCIWKMCYWPWKTDGGF